MHIAINTAHDVYDLTAKLKGATAKQDDSHCIISEGTFGKLILNRNKAKGITVWSNEVMGVDVTGMSCTYGRSFLGVHATLQSPLLISAEGLPSILLKRRECILAYLKNIVANFFELPGHAIKSLHVLYPIYFFRQLMEQYPSFSILVKHAEMGSSYIWHDRPAFIDRKMLEIIEELLHNDYAGKLRTDYIHFKSIDLLFAIARQLLNTDEIITSGNLTPRELEEIYILPAYLEKHLDDAHAVHKLAKRLGMNQVKLNKSFKKIHGLNIHQYIIKLRVNKGYLLTDTTDKTIVEIASITGFSSASHFTSLFKRIYGITPSAMRKLKQ